jgi:hypothetical protein
MEKIVEHTYFVASDTYNAFQLIVQMKADLSVFDNFEFKNMIEPQNYLCLIVISET